MSESIQFNTEDMPSLLYSTLPDNIYKELKQARKTIKYNKSLAGCLEQEHLLDLSDAPLFTYYALELAKYFFADAKDSPVMKELHRCFTKPAMLNFNELWLNEQQPGEYNPLHHHGGLFSFVVYLDIPYSMSEQISIDKNINHVLNGSTEFFDQYNHFGKILTVEKNKHEGLMVMFPAWVMHTVYPFKGKYKNPRVTVSGNINLYT